MDPTMIKPLFQKILIANRGEIAIRIQHTLHQLNITSVAIYALHDRDALFVTQSDEAWPLGEGSLADTYLNIEKIIHIALQSGAQAIHPGYGFLAENPSFAQACQDNGLVFIGPSAASMLLMGNKIEARKAAQQNGLAVTQGITGTVEDILREATDFPLPLLVKAAAGGGGKGMRVVKDRKELPEIIKATAREAESYFGDATVYIEQYIEQPRHIEIQVLGDQYGNAVHLFERECSIQRRYQKIIEESPSPTLTPQLREAMGAAAVALSKSIGYYSAGTIEFLVDQEMKFYFLEMNTRIQVEHPVTEMVTGIDLVKEQIRIAGGEPLSFKQEDIVQKGHAIECRIYAEDPENGFLPSPGNILLYNEPVSNGLRIDSSLNAPTEILSYYDPMISKLIASGENRDAAIQKAVEALKRYAIHGIKTNIPFLTALLEHSDFIANRISTSFCDQNLQRIVNSIQINKEQQNTSLALSAFLLFDLELIQERSTKTIWEYISYWRQCKQLLIEHETNHIMIQIDILHPHHIQYVVDGSRYQAESIDFRNGRLRFRLNGIPYYCFVSVDASGCTLIQMDGVYSCFRRTSALYSTDIENEHSGAGESGNLHAPMPGKVIQVNVQEGQHVNRGTVLLIVEAMKMENNIIAPSDALVEKVFVDVGDMVDSKTQLIILNETKS